MSGHVALPGTQRHLVPGSRSAGPIDPSEIVTLTVRTRPRADAPDLETFVREQAAKRLQDRKYLTRAELAEMRGADPADLDLVEDHAHRHDLVVVRRSAAERSIVLRGRLGDMLAAFPADLHMYHHPRGAYRGRRGEILLPENLKDIVTGVFGYDTRPKHRSRVRGRLSGEDGPGGVNGRSPVDFANRYSFPQEDGGKALDGTGQTIAIIELGGGFRTSDLKLYFKEIGVPAPRVVSVSVDHARNTPGDDADGEVMLDIEVAGAVVPKARFAVYFAPNEGNKGFLDAISAAIHDQERRPSVISISWGAPEEGLDEKDAKAYHDLFVAAAALGVTVCVASGDHGVADLTAQDWDQRIHVDHPSVDPLVLSCGGTQIEGDEDVVWNDKTPFNANVRGGGGWASGGGVSLTYPTPDYQSNAGVPISLANGKTGRGVPDIAMSATDYFVRVDSAEYASGGTSAVAPLMAALVAKLNQAKGKPVGFLNPVLYQNANIVVKDVTKGSNSIQDTVQGYDAGPGWDACAGLGTPIGSAILAAL